MDFTIKKWQFFAKTANFRQIGRTELRGQVDRTFGRTCSVHFGRTFGRTVRVRSYTKMVVEIAGRTVIFLICDFMCNSSGNFSPRASLPKRRALTWATAYNIISYHKINFKIQLLWRHVTTSRILLWRYFMTTLSKSRDFHQAFWGYYRVS